MAEVDVANFTPSNHIGNIFNNYTSSDDVISTVMIFNNKTSPETAACFKIRFNESQPLLWDHPEDLATPEVEAYANQFKLTVLPFLFLIGLPANVMNMAAFCKQGLKDRVNLCLFSLSATDALFLTSSLFLNSRNIYLHFSSGVIQAHSDTFMVNRNLVFFLGSGFLSSSLSAIVACERCFCVIRPLKYKSLMRTRTMALIILFTAGVIFSLYFVVSYRYRVGCVYDPVTGFQMSALIEGEFYRSHRLLVDYLDNFLFGAALTGGVMILVIITTIVTTTKLRQVTSWRSETSSLSHSAREVALTKMLIASSVFFIVCMSPTCLLRTVCLFYPGMSAGGSMHNFYLSTLWISEGFCYLNYTFNFFIYYAMGSKYRETLKGMFCRKSATEGK